MKGDDIRMSLRDKLTDDACNKIYGKSYDELQYSEKVFVNSYVRDLVHPIWKPFEYNGVKTDYIVSNVGQVMNARLNTKVDTKPNQAGIIIASIKIDDTWHQFPVHRLVAALFVDNPDGYNEVVHIIDHPWLNWYKNLKWMTREQMVEQGIGNIGRNSSKYTEEDVVKVVELAKQGKKTKEIATELNVSESFIIGILYRGEWKSVTSKMDLPKIQKSTSSNTIHEICKQLQAGIEPGIIATEVGVSTGVIYGIKSGKIHRYISNQYDIPGLSKDYSVSAKKSDRVFELLEQGVTDTNDILNALSIEDNKPNRKYISKLRQKFKKQSK